jgi:transcriptional regulator with XRE-family HTH domain
MPRTGTPASESNPSYAPVAERLKALSVLSGMTQREIALASGIGHPNVNAILNGSVEPRVTTCLRLLDAMGFGPRHLAGPLPRKPKAGVKP